MLILCLLDLVGKFLPAAVTLLTAILVTTILLALVAATLAPNALLATATEAAGAAEVVCDH